MTHIPTPPPNAWTWTNGGWTLGAVTDPKPADRAPVAAWRRWLLRLLRREYPR